MTSASQMDHRKPFRLSRYSKPGEDVSKPKQPPVYIPTGSKQSIPKPNGGSSEKQPFNPDELSRKLSLYQQELKLARVKRELAALENRGDTVSPHERNDSGHDEESDGKSFSAPTERDESWTEPEHSPAHKRPSSRSQPRPRSRSERRPISKLQNHRSNPTGTYFPRVAAKQFAATTTSAWTAPSPKKGSKSTSSKRQDKSQPSTADSKMLPDSKGLFADLPTVDGFKPFECTLTSSPNLARAATTSGARADSRRSAFLNPEYNPQNPDESSQSHTFRPRPLSTALENLNALCTKGEYAEEENPYMSPLSPTTKYPSQSNNNNNDDDNRRRESKISSIREQQDREAEQRAAEKKEPRPSLKYNDHRHDWSQQSQCGDSPRSSLHLSSMWNRKQSAPMELGTSSSASANKSHRSLKPRFGAGADPRPPIRSRLKSTGDIESTTATECVGADMGVRSDQHLVANAVKLVKEERRRSIFHGLLKRH